MRFVLIGCQVFARELYLLCARAPHPVEIIWMPADLHTAPQKELRPALQAQIDQIEGRDRLPDAILLAYGLCSMATVGLKSRRVPLIIPRAHDCITLLLGSRERYQALFNQHNGGVYWYSPGWIEQFKQPGRGYDEQARYMEYVEKYGEDNAQYLIEVEKGWVQSYSCAALIEWPLLKDERYAEFTRDIARREQLEYLRLEGSSSLMEALVSGDWDDQRFLRALPGQETVYDPESGLLGVASP